MIYDSIIVTGSAQVSGSLSVTGGITGSFQGTATTASYVLNAVSASFATSTATATTASYVLNAVSSSFATSTATATTASYVLNAVSSSFVTSASYVLNAVSASFATTAVTSSFANAFTVAGTLTAQTLVVQTITSSVVYSSGSNIFGNSVSNTQNLTGSVGITGSLTLNNIAIPTSASLASTYLPLAGGTLTGALSGTSATFSGAISGASGTIESGGLNIKGTGATAYPSMLRLSNASNASYYWDIWRDNTTGKLNFGGASGVPIATFLSMDGSTGAATFSSSVTANQIISTTTAAGYAAVLTNTNGASDANGLLVKAGSTSSEYVVRFANQTDAATFFTVKGNGNVGIGSANPTAKLEVRGLSTTYPSATITAGDLIVDTDNKTVYIGRQSNTSGDNTKVIMRSRTGTVGFSYDPSESITYFNDGNVGIGTTSPSKQFTVISLDNNTTTFAGFYALNETQGTEIWYGGIQMGGSNANVDLNLSSKAAANILFNTSGSERMRITTGGTSTVLLGKTTSSYATTSRSSFEINGVDTSILALTRTNDATATAYLYYAADNNLYFQNNKSGGAIYIQSGNAGGVQLTSGSTAFAPQSDERLKNIQGNIENAVNSLMTLRTIIYSWKSDKTNKENLGLIAQDVEKIFPQVIEKSIVKEDPIKGITDTTEYLSLKYTDLIPVLVKAIQELQSQINELKNK